MVENRLRMMIARKNTTASWLAGQLGIDRPLMSYFTRGVALPDKETLSTMCQFLSCTPEDIYDSNDLSLTRERIDGTEKAHAARILTQAESAALNNAIHGLGYQGFEEWLREKYREAVREYASVTADKPLHEIIPHCEQKSSLQ